MQVCWLITCYTGEHEHKKAVVSQRTLCDASVDCTLPHATAGNAPMYSTVYK